MENDGMEEVYAKWWIHMVRTGSLWSRIKIAWCILKGTKKKGGK